MPSVEPQQTVISRSGSISIPRKRFVFAVSASRNFFAPQVMAYWLMSAKTASEAAFFRTSGAAKSGNPCDRLIAPCWMASRVISRITDSVNSAALCEIGLLNTLCRLVGTQNLNRSWRTRSARVQFHSERLDRPLEAGHQKIQRVGLAWADCTDSGYHLVSDDGRLEVEVRVNRIRRNQLRKCPVAARLSTGPGRRISKRRRQTTPQMDR